MRLALQHSWGNALTGLAAGDAWGYQVEFTKFSTLAERFPAGVPAPTKVWRISDDTQMTLALGGALRKVKDPNDIEAVEAHIADAFIRWSVSKDNNRAPGRTCMTSLARLRGGRQWYDPTNGAVESAGCGAVMRLLPTAFASDEHWAGLTALQAVITHKHPRAVVPALLLAEATRNAAAGRSGSLLATTLASCLLIRNGKHPWLQDQYLAEVLAPWRTDIADLLFDGLDDRTEASLLDAWLRLETLPAKAPRSLARSLGDPCQGIGEGWESASAVALGLMIADAAHRWGNWKAALRWAATSNGDSDSIAAIAGSLIGAGSGKLNAWKSAGVAPTFEAKYARALDRLATRLPGH